MPQGKTLTFEEAKLLKKGVTLLFKTAPKLPEYSVEAEVSFLEAGRKGCYVQVTNIISQGHMSPVTPRERFHASYSELQVPG